MKKKIRNFLLICLAIFLLAVVLFYKLLDVSDKYDDKFDYTIAEEISDNLIPYTINYENENLLINLNKKFILKQLINIDEINDQLTTYHVTLDKLGFEINDNVLSAYVNFNFKNKFKTVLDLDFNLSHDNNNLILELTNAQLGNLPTSITDKYVAKYVESSTFYINIDTIMDYFDLSSLNLVESSTVELCISNLNYYENLHTDDENIIVEYHIKDCLKSLYKSINSLIISPSEEQINRFIDKYLDSILQFINNINNHE